MSYGKDERHIDKFVWKLPIPLYDPSDERHIKLAEAGKALEREVSSLELDESKYFVSLRREVRKCIANSEAGKAVESLVGELLTS